eukprot:CAMPEP_0170636478 /NCGR_PEP_ID=MMETSP0224-20130122/37826_1 /TAXON_ID=285029 /ORGANISM="Togula jolla, Strain CCCM 725" /LENGTH=105 /DNA_ID=CAMNT_0010966147 /DNA_START=113 /DNA_END=427 /DNA_ORIENTATION=+
MRLYILTLGAVVRCRGRVHRANRSRTALKPNLGGDGDRLEDLSNGAVIVYVHRAVLPQSVVNQLEVVELSLPSSPPPPPPPRGSLAVPAAHESSESATAGGPEQV